MDTRRIRSWVRQVKERARREPRSTSPTVPQPSRPTIHPVRGIASAHPSWAEIAASWTPLTGRHHFALRGGPGPVGRADSTGSNPGDTAGEAGRRPRPPRGLSPGGRGSLVAYWHCTPRGTPLSTGNNYQLVRAAALGPRRRCVSQASSTHPPLVLIATLVVGE